MARKDSLLVCFLYIAADNRQLGKLFLRKKFAAAGEIFCRKPDSFITEEMIRLGDTACGNM